MSSATLRAETVGGVTYAKVSGIITLAEVNRIRQLLTRPPSGAWVVCLDYSRAVLVLTEADLDVLALAAQPGANSGAMAWIVADETTARRWRVQALRFALAGILRMATATPAEAHRWCLLHSAPQKAPR